MITMAQRIEELRTEKGLSRPALSAALGFPKTAAEKFETGRATPTAEQQKKMADFFGVSLFYLKGESNDKTIVSGDQKITNGSVIKLVTLQEMQLPGGMVKQGDGRFRGGEARTGQDQYNG